MFQVDCFLPWGSLHSCVCGGTKGVCFAVQYLWHRTAPRQLCACLCWVFSLCCQTTGAKARTALTQTYSIPFCLPLFTGCLFLKVFGAWGSPGQPKPENSITKSSSLTCFRRSVSLFASSLQKYSPAFFAFICPVALSGFPNAFIWNSLHFYPCPVHGKRQSSRMHCAEISA